ncbi:MAG: c-type cytochrome, partial [Flavobacteriales bacterium]
MQIRKRTYILAFFSLLLIILSSGNINAQDKKMVKKGEKLFNANCASCHSPGKDVVIGPGLKGVEKRWEGQKDLMYKWIKKPNKVAEMGNDYVDDLIEEYKPEMMTPQPVTNKEIDAILAYVKNYEPEKKVAKNEGEKSGGKGKEKEGDIWIWLLIITILLLVIISSLNSVRRTLLFSVKEKKGESPPEDIPFIEQVKKWTAKHKVATSLIVIFLLLGGMKQGWDGLMGVGVYQGYKPEQPIWFSHKVHAGKDDISCIYCHSNAKKGKYATIPSANVCMNCHEHIDKGENTGKKEIKKLYDAVGWNPETRSYSGETKPIKWVKVHELPDLVYFNHSQHTKVGQIECQECHGE